MGLPGTSSSLREPLQRDRGDASRGFFAVWTRAVVDGEPRGMGNVNFWVFWTVQSWIAMVRRMVAMVRFMVNFTVMVTVQFACELCRTRPMPHDSITKDAIPS